MLTLLAQVENQVEPFIDVRTVLVILGVVGPFVTAILARAGLDDRLKALISGVFIAAAALAHQLIEGGDFTWQAWLNGAIQILVVHVMTWVMAKPLVLDVNEATGGFGIGHRSAPVDSGAYHGGD